MKSLHHVILLALFAIWFGGFTFYTAIVVPIGTDVLGSSRTQGFITQQVTNKLNFIGGLTILMMLIDLFYFRQIRSKAFTIWFGVSIAGIAILWSILLLVHPMLDALLQPEHDHVLNDERFYFLHRIYLWTSTIQWLLCWMWLVLYARSIGPKSKIQTAIKSR